MDDVLSPKRAAKVKAKCGKSPVQSDTDDPGEEQDSATHYREGDREEESSDELLKELLQASKPVLSPGCRRSSRMSSKEIPNYDVRYVVSPLLTVISGRHSTIDNVDLGSIPLLIRLCVQLLPGLR